MNHPNKLPFEGVLTWLDVPSDRSPSGARGHRVILQKQAAEAALSSLIGMAVDFNADLDGHSPRSKCGVITDAGIDGRCLSVKGYLFVRNFPELLDEAQFPSQKLGMSYELADANVEDMRAKIWTLTKVTFVGAAVLLADKAAYRNTSFRMLRAGCGLAMAAFGVEMVATDDRQK